MTDIYSEALADKKRLVEVATANAKDKVVEAVTPRIKQLIESALLGELSADIVDDDEDILLGSHDDIDVGGLSAPGIDQMPGSDAALSGVLSPVAPAQPPQQPGVPGVTLPGPDGKVTLDVDALTSGPSGGSTFELTPESIHLLGRLVAGSTIDFDATSSRIKRLREDIQGITERMMTSHDTERIRQIRLECERLYADVQGARAILDEGQVIHLEEALEDVFNVVMENYSTAGHLTRICNEMMAVNRRAYSLNEQIGKSSRLPTRKQIEDCADMMHEVKDLHERVCRLFETLDADGSVDIPTVKGVGANLATLYTEMRKMVTTKNKVNEADELDAAPMGGDDAMGMDDMSMDGDVDGERVLVQLELPASLKDIDASAVNVVSVGPAGDDVGDEMDGLDDIGVDDAGGPPVDTGDDAVEEEGSMYETQLHDDDIIEIDEAILVAELSRIKKLREKKYEIAHGGHGPGDLSDFGGGKEEGEKFVDGQDLNQSDPVGSDGYLEEGESLQEEGDDEEKLDEEDYGVSGDKASKKQSKKEMGESRQKMTGKNGSSKSDKQLAEIRAELAEQKLFNTKLIALNKVLHFPGLSKAQKKQVVETLDRGRTVAEVKQLYSKIVEHLTKKRDEAVNESASSSSRGSSSRATTSAAPAATESDPLVERWNKIAFGGPGVIQG